MTIKNFLSTADLFNHMSKKYGKPVSFEGNRETKAFGFYTHENSATKNYGSPTYLKNFIYIKESIGNIEKTPYRVVIYPFGKDIQNQLMELPIVLNGEIQFNQSEYGLKTVKNSGYVKFVPKIANTQYGIEVAALNTDALDELISFISQLSHDFTSNLAIYPPKK